MDRPYRSARTRAWLRTACFAAALAVSAPAQAADDGALGFALAFGMALGVAGAATPYLVGADWKDPAPATVALGLGAGRHLNAYSLGSDFGGYLRHGGFLGWMGRARFDLSGERATRGYTALRIDSVALLRLAGAPTKPLLLEGLTGLTVWPRIETSPARKTRVFAGVGPTLGLRLRARNGSPHVYSELEVDYAPLFGAPPSGQLHHLELGAAFGFTPWPKASGVFAFEMRGRFEVGLGSADVTRTAGVSLLGGVRIRLELLQKVAPPPPSGRGESNRR